MDKNSPVNKGDDSVVSKKSYRTPELRTYGNIREITQGAGRVKNRDSGSTAGTGFKSLP